MIPGTVTVSDENQSKHKEVTSESSRLTDEASTRQSSMPRENKWSGRVDSKGFRILTSQIVDVQHLTQDELVGYLKDSIIYEDGMRVGDILRFSRFCLNFN